MESSKEETVVEEKEEVVVEQIPSQELPVSEARDVCIGSVEEDDSRLEGDPSVAERPTEIVLEEVGAEASVAPLTAEAVEAIEALASVSTEGEGKEVPFVGTAREEESLETTEVAPALPLEHRASWWNCCGLLDVFKGSR